METSLKGIIQGLSQPDISLTEGTVVQEDPLEVELANENITLSTSSVVVPQHLTDYEVTFGLLLKDGEMGGETGTAGNHVHPLASLEINNGSVKVCNALKEGDKVMMLSYNRGKKYYILDRVV